MTSKNGFLTEARRDFIQRTMLNIFTITVGAAYASNFFTSFQAPIRILLWLFAVSVWWLGFLIKREG